MAVNLDDIFQQTARNQPGHPALVGPSSEDLITYGALDEAIGFQSARLVRAGVRRGHCVGVHVSSGTNYIKATYAAWRCGACVVPLPIELVGPEKEQILRTVALDYVVSLPQTAAFLAPFRCGQEVELDSGCVVYPVQPQRQPPAGFQEINSAFVRFTSGTTAAAKGVVLSHQTILERIQAANDVLHLGPKDRVIWLLSMAYHFAVSIVAYLSYGATIVLPANHFAQALLTSARQKRATLIYGSPTHYAWLARAADAGPLPDLRLAISTTAGLDPVVGREFLAVFGLPITQALGIIEIGLPFINVDFAAEHGDAVGRVLPAYRLRLQDVGLGEGHKEVLLNGPGFLDAYYDPWKPRAAILQDGWFHTGDVAEVDARGCVFLRGRVKDVISVLGMKFFPQEVEAVLVSHPAVSGACVFARPDPRLGEVAQALVVLRPDAQDPPSEHDLLSICRKQLASFKVPEHIEFVAALPRTASGKVLHRPMAWSGGDKA